MFIYDSGFGADTTRGVHPETLDAAVHARPAKAAGPGAPVAIVLLAAKGTIRRYLRVKRNITDA